VCASASAEERAVALLAAAGEVQPEALPIGERDARLLELRARTFGPLLELVVECPRCQDKLEFSVEAARLAERRPVEDSMLLPLTDGEAQFRLLDSRDLQSAANAEDPVRHLFERSVVAVRRNGLTLDASALDEAERARLSERLAELEPGLSFALNCPTCEHTWQSPFEPGAFLYAEVTSAAQRILREVAMLATAFGWSEPEVLALSATRRRAYLELAGS
jgi:hypothetical protein